MSIKADAWMPLWIGSYLADTQHLSRDEHGGYLLLIMAYWRTGAALPDDNKRLAAIVRASAKEWKILRPVLAEFFHITDGLWHHKRIDQELADAANNRAQKSAAGKASAAKRWGNIEVTDVTNPLQRQSNPTHTPLPTPNNQDGGNTHTENSELGATACLTTGIVCKRIIELGIPPTSCNPGNPTLAALIAAGADIAEFEGAARAAVGKGKDFRYMLGILTKQREEAAGLKLHKGQLPEQTSNDQAREDARRRLFGGENAAS